MIFLNHSIWFVSPRNHRLSWIFAIHSTKYVLYSNVLIVCSIGSWSLFRHVYLLISILHLSVNNLLRVFLQSVLTQCHRSLGYPNLSSNKKQCATIASSYCCITFLKTLVNFNIVSHNSQPCLNNSVANLFISNLFFKYTDTMSVAYFPYFTVWEHIKSSTHRPVFK